jgi:hypothetical protein
LVCWVCVKVVMRYLTSVYKSPRFSADTIVPIHTKHLNPLEFKRLYTASNELVPHTDETDLRLYHRRDQ